MDLATEKSQPPGFDYMRIWRPASAVIELACFVLVFACCTLVVQSVYKTAGLKLAIGATIVSLSILPLSSKIIGLCSLPARDKRLSYALAIAQVALLANYSYHAYHQPPVKQALALIYAAVQTVVPLGLH